MYFIIELQRNGDGSCGNIVQSAATANEAKSKYHLVLSSAAVSDVMAHSAVLVDDHGHLLASECYEHIPAPVPEPDEEEPAE